MSRPSEQQISIYLKYLEPLELPESVWQTAEAKLIAESEVKSFPSISQIRRAVQGSAYNRPIDSAWVMFTQNGLRYARRCTDHRNPPNPPDSATDIDLHLPDHLCNYRILQASEGLEISRQAYISSGGKPGAWGQPTRSVAQTASVDRKPQPERWWDDD